jgi:mannose-1-phosphate guanylyltransferase
VALVGGLGTRLRPLTLDTPKQMLPVVDRPMLEWLVGHLANHGVDEVVLSLGYRSDAFTAAYPGGACAGVRLTTATEPTPLDTAGAIRFAATAAGIDERFLVLNADVITDIDISALVAFHDHRGAEGTISLHRVDDPSRYGVLPTDDDGRVTAFVEKPPPGEAPTDLINAGIYVLEPSVLDRIADGRKVSIERETFPAMVADGTLYALDDGGAYWLDTGTPQTFLQAQFDMLDQNPSLAAVDGSAQVASDAHVVRSVVGRDAHIASGADVVDSVVMAGATVGRGARVRCSIVGPGAVVGARACIDEYSVVGGGVHVAENERVVAARVPDVPG